jgi:hypothetical protein
MRRTSRGYIARRSGPGGWRRRRGGRLSGPSGRWVGEAHVGGWGAVGKVGWTVLCGCVVCRGKRCFRCMQWAVWHRFCGQDHIGSHGWVGGQPVLPIRLEMPVVKHRLGTQSAGRRPRRRRRRRQRLPGRPQRPQQLQPLRPAARRRPRRKRRQRPPRRLLRVWQGAGPSPRRGQQRSERPAGRRARRRRRRSARRARRVGMLPRCGGEAATAFFVRCCSVVHSPALCWVLGA